MVFRKGSSLTLAAMTVAATTVVFFSPAGPVAADTGCPTAAAPTQVGGVYEIDTVDKLQWAKDVGQMSNNYKLTANIDMTGCTWSNGIGSSATPYTGIFDGNSKTISNLTVSGANQQNLGLIDFLNGTVSDLTLVSPSVSGTNDWKGSLAGRLGATGSISNVTATSVNISGNQLSGGLVGQAASGSTISTVSVSGIVTGTGTWAGGIAGDSQATITSAVSSVNVTGTNNVGGLAGAMSYAGTFISSRSTGNVTGSYGVAGAVGSVAGVRPSCGTLTGVTTSGTISGSTQVGGLFGAANCYFINQSSSSASVTASADKAGGLVGYENNSGDINRSFFTGQVQATEIVGGIGGLLRGQVRSTYSTGAVTATSGTNGGRAGGLIGWVSGAQVEHSFAAGIVTPPSSGSTSTTGGLFGNYASGTLLNSVWDMTASGRATSGGSFAKGFTTQQLRNYVLYNSDNLNWSITNGISSGDGVTTGTTWSICSGVASGYPFLTWQGLSGSCQPTMAYNGNGSTSGTAPSDGSTPYTSGATVTVAGNTGTLAKTGSIFAGWNTKANGSGTPYSAGDTFTITSPVMLFAQWTALPTITYASNGGLGSITSQSGASGSSVTLSTGTGFTRTGYVLSRWDTSAFGTGTSYAKGETITMPGGGLNLWAVWTALPTITYASNGGSGSITSQSGASGSSVTLSTGTGFTRSGYVLSRWDTSSSGTGTSYAKGETITMPGGGLNLWAVWTVDPSATTTTTTVVATTTTTTVVATTTTVPTAATTTTVASATTSTQAPDPTLPASGATTTSVAAGSSSSAGGQTGAGTVSNALPAQTGRATTTTVVALTTTTTVPTREIPDVEGVERGSAGATLGGREVTPEITEDAGSVIVKVGDATVRYTVVDAAGARRSLTSAQAVALQPGDIVTVQLNGFADDGEATSWLVPGDVALGSTQLLGGTGTITGTVPNDVTGGSRRIVTAAESRTGEPLVVAYGVDVNSNVSDGPSWSLVFLVIVGLAMAGGLLVPAARRGRDSDTSKIG